MPDEKYFSSVEEKSLVPFTSLTSRPLHNLGEWNMAKTPKELMPAEFLAR